MEESTEAQQGYEENPTMKESTEEQQTNRENLAMGESIEEQQTDEEKPSMEEPTEKIFIGLAYLVEAGFSLYLLSSISFDYLWVVFQY
ncbi:hypothetical protein QQP08_020161 [Theobroma cacao]|nr:hypothetical protein QQP08_020161 [Theobroma cacao]